jgi:hypothetical protein
MRQFQPDLHMLPRCIATASLDWDDKATLACNDPSRRQAQCIYKMRYP